VDTGASTVVLTLRDAMRAGYSIDDLRFTAPISTANGRTVAAPLRIGEIAVGDIKAVNVQGLVARPGALSQSLLGMSFLDRLSRWEVSGDRLMLVQ
ncbi:MAG: TIGR02281 family clan AA aspartic protease, partial [Hyphomicrobiales bacterium]|nr:TIGR02281 family clan AA aspartic protease [Hyphomicrobiales bacterium]